MNSPPQRKVNFDDNVDGYSTYTPPRYDPYDFNAPHSSADTPSQTTSGFLAHDSPTVAKSNPFTTGGETHDASRSLKSEPSIYSQGGLDRRSSGASMLRSSYVPPGKDSLVDADEGYGYSDRGKGLNQDDDASLVHNSADMGRTDQPRTMGDLGNSTVLCASAPPLTRSFAEYQDPYSKNGEYNGLPAKKESPLARFLGYAPSACVRMCALITSFTALVGDTHWNNA